MTEAELGMFADYSRKRFMPHRRVEIMLARLCMYMDAYMGGRKNAKLADYLLDAKVEDFDEIGDNEDELKAYFGFNPINVEQNDGL